MDVAAPLAKAVVLSAAVHQCVFSWRSTLPFAIGQVQDAGLIFLSKMATDVARSIDGTAHDVAATALQWARACWVDGHWEPSALHKEPDAEPLPPPQQ